MRTNTYQKKLHSPLICNSWFVFRPSRLSLPTNLPRTRFSFFLSDRWMGRWGRLGKCTSQSYTTVFKGFSNHGTCCRAEFVILGISLEKVDQLTLKRVVLRNTTNLDAWMIFAFFFASRRFPRMENASQNSKERNNKRHVLLKWETGGWANLGSEGSDSWSGEGERDEAVDDDSESARRDSFSSSLELRLSVVCSVSSDMVVKELVAVVGV